MFKNFFSFCTISKIGDNFSRQDLENRGLTNPVLSNKAYNRLFLGEGEAVESKAVGSILVYYLQRKLIREVDYGYGIEGTFVDTDTASCAELFRYYGLSLILSNNCLIPHPHSRTKPYTLLGAGRGLTFVFV